MSDRHHDKTFRRKERTLSVDFSPLILMLAAVGLGGGIIAFGLMVGRRYWGNGPTNRSRRLSK